MRTPKPAKLARHYLQRLNTVNTETAARTEARQELVEYMLNNGLTNITQDGRNIELITTYKLKVTTPK